MDELFTFIETHLFLLLAVLFIVGFIVWLIYRSITANEKRESTRSFWSYLFIWPLLLTRKEGGKTVQRGFTRREWIWWLIFAVIALLAILFTPTVKK